jgi:hypothetical protein
MVRPGPNVLTRDAGAAQTAFSVLGCQWPVRASCHHLDVLQAYGFAEKRLASRTKKFLETVGIVLHHDGGRLLALRQGRQHLVSDRDVHDGRRTSPAAGSAQWPPRRLAGRAIIATPAREKAASYCVRPRMCDAFGTQSREFAVERGSG